MYRSITILLLALCFAGAATCNTAAEPQSLIDLRSNALGGYGGPQFKATVLHGQFALYGGGVARYKDPVVPKDSPRLAGIAAIESEVLLSFRILPTFRIGIGAGYRLILPIREIEGIATPELSGPVAPVQLQCGISPRKSRSLL